MRNLRLGKRRTAAAVLRAARRAGAWSVLLVASVAFAGLGLLPHLGLYRPVTVLSDSMKPAFAAGDLILVTPKPLRQVRAGDVIVYSPPVGERRVVTHRVVRLAEGGDRPVVVTKGDANPLADPWQARLEGETVWRHRLTVPLAGHAILFLRRPAVRAAALYAAPAALALVCLAGIWRPRPTDRRRIGEQSA